LDGDGYGGGGAVALLDLLRLGALLDGQDVALAEEIGAQLLLEVAAVAAQPFKDHRGVLDLLAHVVEEDRLQRRILAVVGALLVPVRRLELLHERDDRLVARDRLRGEPLPGRVQVLAGHETLLSVIARMDAAATPRREKEWRARRRISTHHPHPPRGPA
jgi:hypothetical protein